jgi:5-oxopent-3-ene-1,2,5-tricarboxylate decarboxylase/2-hydroxyhepta-2,4-diene-1,7-dioate isomerase
MALDAAVIGVSPYRLSGTVYGTLLNHRGALAALGPALHEAPYKAPPKAPILYIKPRNTLNGPDANVAVPSDAPELEVGACVGLVIARAACRLRVENALEHVAGYVIVNDISVPHHVYYRPSIRLKARDGFCPIGAFVPRMAVANPNALSVRVFVDDVLESESSTADHVRSVEQLLVDVTEFMTLAAGDVLAVGAGFPAPRVRAGQSSRIEIAGLGSLLTHFVAGDA